MFDEWHRTGVSNDRIFSVELTSCVFLEAISMAYSFQNFGQYNSYCFRYLNSNIEPPKCIIKVNTFSLIKYLKDKNYFDDGDVDSNPVV